jgi:DNA-binding transcriptional MocR family regulator
MTPLSELPMPNDMDADYSPAFMRLARMLRDQIRTGQYKPGDKLPPSASLAREHGISRRTALHALEVLAANKYVTRSGDFRPYHVTGHPTAELTTRTPRRTLTEQS